MGKTAVEYASDQITVYPSCPHKCKYCWASEPLMLKRISNPKPIEEARGYLRARKPRIIVVSFTTDPYQPIERHISLTRHTLEILVPSIHTIMVLTKNPEFAVLRDLDLLQHSNVWLGTTLTGLEKLEDEPFAPSNLDRIIALDMAHKHGVHTWVSIEPWIPYKTDPYEIILKTNDFVDWYVIGRLNHEKRHGYETVPNWWYQKRLPKIEGLLKALKKPYLIKKELRL